MIRCGPVTEPEQGKGATARRWSPRKIAAGLGKLMFLGAAFMTVLLTSGYFSMRLALQGRRVTVPDVTGMTTLEAEEALVRSDLYLEVAAEKYDDRLEAGRILAQDPVIGAAIKKFRKVKVVTSLGPRVFKIPELSGHLLRSALIELEAEGLRAGHVVYAHTPEAGADVVVTQDPPPSGESLGHSGVSLLVSKGPRESVYVMPDLAGLEVNSVAAQLRAQGLSVGSIRREPHAWLPRGAVSRQYPEPGYPVSTSDPITLVASR